MLLNKILFYLASMQRIFLFSHPPIKEWEEEEEEEEVVVIPLPKMEWKENYQDSNQHSEVHGYHLHSLNY